MKAPLPPVEHAGHSSTPSSVLDWTANFWLRFDRFGKDLLGVFLVSVSLVILLGLTGITNGIFLTSMVLFLRRWLGWGSLLAGVGLGYLGLLALRRQKSPHTAIRIGRVLAVEGWFFINLSLLSVINGHSLERADAGGDGGAIGWALAHWLYSFLPEPAVNILLLLLWLVLGAYGFGLLGLAAAKLDHWLLEGSEEESAVNSPSSTDVFKSQPVRTTHQPSTLPAGRQRLDKPLEAPQPAVNIQRDERLPPLNLLMQDHLVQVNEETIHVVADKIEKTLEEFGVPARVVGFRVGPTVTQYAVEPGFVEKPGPEGEMQRQKVRVAAISSLQRDLALALSAERLRIEAPVPGQSFVGVEVPNPQGSLVRLRSLLESEEFNRMSAPLAIALGRDVSGLVVAADLARMPHLLVAGTTGSGKSVCIAALTTCLVMNNTPDELRIAMIDPKMVELVRFNGLPHLLGKVETQLERMLGVLKWALMEMDRRYRLLEEAHARDLAAYNRKMERKKMPTLPRVVVMIDELADLMMSAPDQTEHAVVRLAQMARATGIHLVVATQRPSTDVVTGLIKANFPARIAFTVASSVDSRVILDTNGAETLLGRGDMLFLNPEAGKPVRAQGAILTDQEVDRVVNFWKKMSPGTEENAPWEEMLALEGADDGDKLVEEAVKVVRRSQHASASLLQRRLRIGYPRAARLLDELEELGVVGPSQGGGREREVLIPAEDDDEMDEGEVEDFE